MTRYFAELENNIVKRVVSAEDAQWCVENLGGQWVETYYDVADKNYAGIGDVYNPELDNFIPNKPYSSWVLDSNCKWKPPFEQPKDGKLYEWDESITNWKEFNF